MRRNVGDVSSATPDSSLGAQLATSMAASAAPSSVRPRHIDFVR
jgi:hypothetical protein